jgi:hypothetical protein
MRAVDVAVVFADIRAANRRPEIVDLIGDIGKVDELVRVGLEQDPWIAGRLAVAETIVVHLTKLGLLAPALSIGRFVSRRQHAGADAACEPLALNEDLEVCVAGRLPETVPARHGHECVLGAAFCLLEQIGVVLFRGRELARRLDDLQRRPEASPEGTALCERGGRHTERDRADSRPSQQACRSFHEIPRRFENCAFDCGRILEVTRDFGQRYTSLVTGSEPPRALTGETGR